MSQAEHFVDFKNVWLAYNEALLAQNQFAVEDINLQVKQGEFIAIVGPSGCGKSTFMKLTTGLKAPTRGTIHVDGQAVNGPLKISGNASMNPISSGNLTVPPQPGSSPNFTSGKPI